MKFIDFQRYKYYKFYKNVSLKKYKSISGYYARLYNLFSKTIFLIVHKLIDIKKYNFSKIYKSIKWKKYKHIPTYVVGVIVFLIIIYISIPLFFNYDKSKVQNQICQDFNISCKILGDIRYNILPTPRIILINFVIKSINNKNETLGVVENVEIKLSLHNLLHRNRINFSTINLIKAKVNFNLNNFKKYKNFFKTKPNFKNINLETGELEFFDNKKSLTSIKNISFKYGLKENIDALTLRGNFLNNDIYINLKNKKNKDNPSKFLMIKFMDTNTQVNIFDSKVGKNIISGNISSKKNNNRLTAIFDYGDNQIFFKHANVRNIFLDGKFSGIVTLLPYFNFDLDIDLNTINFNRLHSYLIALSPKNKKNLFKINKKINGQLNLSAEKIFSKRTLINSLESRLIFTNGNILIEQLLLSLGKLGAADITGVIDNDKKYSTLKFENNIFLDNLKRFYNKFGIFNKERTPTNLFISGNLDLMNLRLHLNEISEDEKFSDEDIAYFEKKFNDILLENGYASLFNFLNLKNFIGSITE